MFWTHHFAHQETLNRARSWLVQLGFAPDRLEVHANGVPRLALTVDPLELAAVEMVVSVAERTDPEGWPSFWDVARQDHIYPVATPEPAAKRRRSGAAIGWHPPD